MRRDDTHGDRSSLSISLTIDEATGTTTGIVTTGIVWSNVSPPAQPYDGSYSDQWPLAATATDRSKTPITVAGRTETYGPRTTYGGANKYVEINATLTR